jgi:signal transduction histidine kinase
MTEEMTGRRNEDLRSAAIQSILEVTSDFQSVGNVDLLLKKIGKTVAETFGLAKVTIGIREKDTGLYAIKVAYGFDPEREEKIRKVRYTRERMERDLRPEFRVGRNTYYIPAESWELEGEEDMMFMTRPERLDRPRRFPDEWAEADYIDFLMYTRDGDLLGYLEIDEPDDNKVPSDDKLMAIEVFSDLAAIAIQNAELYGKLEDDRKKIELLLDLIGHDVNNYAQAVSGFIELAISRKGVPEPSRKSMTKALDQIWNLNKLINNVNLFAKVESAGNKDLQPTDLVKVVKDAFTAAESCCPSKVVKVSFVDDGTPKIAMINNLAKDAFLNIFTNAIKFDEHEVVEVDVQIGEMCDDKRLMWCVSVADHGPGVEDEMKQKIFDRFTQGSGPARGSSGLGLHIAKTLVNSYKGRIWVEDRVPGDRSQGSVFKVAIPKAPQQH